MDFGTRQFSRQLTEFVPSFGRHFHVERGIAGWMTVFVVLEARDRRIRGTFDLRAGSRVTGQLFDRVRFKVFSARREVWSGINDDLIHVGLVKRFDAGRERLVGQNDHRCGILFGQTGGLDRDVEAIFDILRGDHNARCITMTAVDGLHEVTLLDVGR